MGIELAINLKCNNIIVESESVMADKFLMKDADVWSNLEGIVNNKHG